MTPAQIYARAVLPQVPRLLGSLDREPHSVSYGSFDRAHWGWKFRDFPITMAQMAMYPLALLWRHSFPENPYYRNSQLKAWMEGAIESTLRRQHANGSFDSVGPWTQDHGVSLAMVYGLTETTHLLGDALAPRLAGAVAGCVERACRFALRSHEDYAFISNHQALFALAFHNAFELYQEPAWKQQTERILNAIFDHQSPEGWFREYEGADPGYESLGMFYLAKLWQRTRSERLLAALRRAVEFFAHCVHPDGSVGGVYGSRCTSLYIPGGFEILSGEIPLAGAVARFMRTRLDALNVVTPASADMENLSVLAYTYLEGCLAAREQAAHAVLPCEALHGVRRFPQSGFVFAGARCYYAVANTSKGGVCRIFDRATGQLAYEDAGYLLRSGQRWQTSQLAELGRALETNEDDRVACETSFAEVFQELLTPAKFVLLRLLNLTVFRSLALGAWIRRRVVARLILAKRITPFRLRRSIRFCSDEIRFSDELSMTQPGQVDELDLPRSFMAIHMGSAKYFHPSELETTPHPSVAHLRDELNQRGQARHEFVLRFQPGSPVVIDTGASTSQPTEKIAL